MYFPDQQGALGTLILWKRAPTKRTLQRAFLGIDHSSSIPTVFISRLFNHNGRVVYTDWVEKRKKKETEKEEGVKRIRASETHPFEVHKRCARNCRIAERSWLQVLVESSCLICSFLGSQVQRARVF